jgi:cytochrome c biogenesis protein CcmG/thiol:disulfide interchange protein DsbE
VSRATRAVWAPSIVAVLFCLGACDGSSPSTTADSPETGPIQVDTATLRQQKAAAGIADCPPSEGEPAAHDGMPDVTLPCLGGGRDVDLAGLTGIPTVINFWAQSCGPCRVESPFIEEVHESMGDRVQVLGVDWQDTEPGAAIAFADELGITYPQLADPSGETRAPLAILGLPITVFVASSGRITHVESGPIDSVDQLESLIFDHLGVAPETGGAS